MSNDGGPAFPCVTGVAGYGTSRPTGQTSPDGRMVFEDLSTGLTLRDFFAAKAMASLASQMMSQKDSHDQPTGIMEPVYSTGFTSNYGGDFAELSADAYALADAMLAERTKGPK